MDKSLGIKTLMFDYSYLAKASVTVYIDSIYNSCKGNAW